MVVGPCLILEFEIAATTNKKTRHKGNCKKKRTEKYKEEVGKALCLRFLVAGKMVDHGSERDTLTTSLEKYFPCIN